MAVPNECGLDNLDIEAISMDIREALAKNKNKPIDRIIAELGYSEENIPAIHSAFVNASMEENPTAGADHVQAIREQAKLKSKPTKENIVEVRKTIYNVSRKVGLSTVETSESGAVQTNHDRLYEMIEELYGVEKVADMSWQDQLDLAATMASSIHQVPVTDVLENGEIAPFQNVTQGEVQHVASFPKTSEGAGEDLARGFFTGRNKKKRKRMWYASTLSNVLDKFGASHWMQNITQGQRFMSREFEAQMNAFKQKAKELGLKWNKKQVNRIYLNGVAKTPSERAILERQGVRIPELSVRETEMQDFMEMRFEEIFQLRDNVRISMGQKPIRHQENYWPLVRDYHELAKEGLDIFTGSSMPNTIRASLKRVKEARNNHLITRVKGSKIPLKTNGLEILEGYYKESYHHIYVAPEIAKIKNIIDRKHKLNSPITDIDGVTYGTDYSMPRDNPMMHGYLTDWLNHIQGQHVDDPLDWTFPVSFMGMKLELNLASTLRILSRNVSRSYSLGNLSTIVSQPLQMTNAILFMNPGNYIRGTIQSMIDWTSDIAHWDLRSQTKYDRGIRAYIPILGQRMGETYMHRNNQLKWSWNPLRNLDNIGGAILTAIDEFSTQSAAYGFFLDAKAKGMSDVEAGKYASKMTQMTQGDATAKNRTPFQRTSVGEATFLLQNYLTTLNTLMRLQIFQVDRRPGEPMSKKNFMKASAMALAFVGLQEAVGNVYQLFMPVLV